MNMVQVEELYKERLYLSVRIEGTLTSAVNLRPYLKKTIDRASFKKKGKCTFQDKLKEAKSEQLTKCPHRFRRPVGIEGSSGDSLGRPS